MRGSARRRPAVVGDDAQHRRAAGRRRLRRARPTPCRRRAREPAWPRALGRARAMRSAEASGPTWTRRPRRRERAASERAAGHLRPACPSSSTQLGRADDVAGARAPGRRRRRARRPRRAARVERERPRGGDPRPVGPHPGAQHRRAGRLAERELLDRAAARARAARSSRDSEDPAERHHREDVPVEVVVEVEVAGEAGAGEVRLVPAAVRPLRLDEPADRAAAAAVAVRLAGRVQAEQRPGRLRRGRGAAPAPGAGRGRSGGPRRTRRRDSARARASAPRRGRSRARRGRRRRAPGATAPVP